MAKKGKLRIAKSSLKRLILEMSVDNEGSKVSDRVLWSNPEFMSKTGLFSVDEYTSEKSHCSLGTISYYKKLLKLNALDIFTHHQMVTGKIEPLVLFEEWNLRCNVKAVVDGVLSEKSKKSNLIRDFELGDGSYYSTYTLKELENAIIELLNMMGENGKKELEKYYKGVK